MRILTGLLLVILSCTSHAQMYRWTDAKGRVHFSDTPPLAGARSVQKRGEPRRDNSRVEAKGQDSAAGRVNVNEPYAVKVARERTPVTLYTGLNCNPCTQARTLLNARGVPFKEIFVSDEASLAAFQKTVGGGVVPSIAVGANTQRGFAEGAYHALLDAAGYPKQGILPATKRRPAADAPRPKGPTAIPSDSGPADAPRAAQGPYRRR